MVGVPVIDGGVVANGRPGSTAFDDADHEPFTPPTQVAYCTM